MEKKDFPIKVLVEIKWLDKDKNEKQVTLEGDRVAFSQHDFYPREFNAVFELITLIKQVIIKLKE